jgi:endogenous inhibitor of DNA gyrase (YacG/DUF329 family)
MVQIRYTVRGIAEEFECPECGWPVYAGERAVEDTRLTRCYCSFKCSNAARGRADAEESTHATA